MYMAMTNDRAAATAADAWRQTAWRLVEVEPTTIEGVAALARIARLRWQHGEPFEGLADRKGKRLWIDQAFQSIERALHKIAMTRPAMRGAAESKYPLGNKLREVFWRAGSSSLGVSAAGLAVIGINAAL
jgi:hypothetical protein